MADMQELSVALFASGTATLPCCGNPFVYAGTLVTIMGQYLFSLCT